MITLHSLYTLIQMNNGVFDKVEAKKRRTTPQEAVQNMKDILNKKKSFIKVYSLTFQLLALFLI